jgi:hypothetical protein
MEMNSSAVYEIRIKGRLTAERSAWFEEMTVTAQANGETLLRGELRDQAALHGVLAKIRDLGLPLLKVECLASL